MADTLRDELLNDPLIPPRGYSTMSDQEATDDLNSLTTGRTRPRTSMTSTEVWQAIEIPELRALADGDRSLIMAVLQFDQINPFGNEAALFTALFGGGSATIAALQAARQETVSRAVELEIKSPVKVGHVAVARA